MFDLSDGIPLGPVEESYQQWLAHHPTGLVLNLKRGPGNRLTIHRATCRTIVYDLFDKHQKRRSGKVCFESERELTDYCRAALGIERADLHRCPRC